MGWLERPFYLDSRRLKVGWLALFTPPPILGKKGRSWYIYFTYLWGAIPTRCCSSLNAKRLEEHSKKEDLGVEWGGVIWWTAQATPGSRLNSTFEISFQPNKKKATCVCVFFCVCVCVLCVCVCVLCVCVCVLCVCARVHFSKSLPHRIFFEFLPPIWAEI